MSKHLTVPHPSNRESKYVFKKDEPPYSIPGVHLPLVQVYDDLVSAKLHKELYDYLLKQVWYLNWPEVPAELQLYIPNKFDEGWALSALHPRYLQFSRCGFGSDEKSIENTHPLVHQLWLEINKKLNYQYEITGTPEGMLEQFKCPPTVDPDLEQGWRVYANATAPGMIALEGFPHVHRDSVDLYDDSFVTIIWMANTEWYPTWGSELIFYPEDSEGTTGDHQQFTGEVIGQRRNYKIGWPDEGKLVCTKPNRLLIYDGRTMHSSNSSRNNNINQLNRRIVFRARRKSK